MAFLYEIISQAHSYELLYLIFDIIAPILLAWGCWKVSHNKKTATLLAILLLVIILFRMVLARIPSWEYAVFSNVDYSYFNTWHYIFFCGFAFCVLPHLPRKTTKIAVVVFAIFLYILNIAEILWILDRVNIKCRNQIGRDGVCQQSTAYNCGAASCVTLLSLYDIDSNEQEMIDLCLTQRRRGTFFLGAIRGLKLKIKDYYEVVMKKVTYQQLLELNQPGLVSIELQPRLFHMVCLMAITETKIAIGDPLSGKREMTREDFEKRTRGFIVYLQKK